MIKIIIIILIIIIYVFVINYFHLLDIENFKISSHNSSNRISGQNFMKNSGSVSGNVLYSQSKSNNNKTLNNIQNNYTTPGDKLKSLKQTKQTNLIEQKNQIKEIDQKVLFDNKDYNENLSIDNKDNKYFYTDMINQSNINETAFNIVYSIDPIDYADVKTGLDKCNQECGGVCFENGYDGNTTCYPKESQPFDWGTLYKNPTFTYGYNAYGPENLKQ